MRLSIKLNSLEVTNIILSRPHLVKEYFFCNRRFVLNLIYFYNQNSERLSIGRSLHDKKPQVSLPIKVDSIDWKNKQIIEFKKKEFDIGAILQAYIYLKNISAYNSDVRTAIVKSIEKKNKKIINYPDEYLENLFSEMLKQVNLITKIPPKKKKRTSCSNCSLFEYCWV